MKITEVTTPELARQFILVNVMLYKNDPHYIRPLDKDVNEVFDPSKNKAHVTGETRRWLLQDDAGRYIGRIAAYYNPKYRNKGDAFKVGGLGFFDCIHDQVAANLLFDTARDWLQSKGVEAMDGPINFGERDKWWGLVVEGFHPPLYGMNYNAPYYQELFENYGFKVFYNQYCWSLRVDMRVSDKFYEAHDRFINNPDVRAERINKNNLEKYARDFAVIYNKAWAKHEGNKEIRPAQALRIFKMMKPVMDEDIVWFTYHKEEPIAMWLNVPDLNQIFRHLNGQFNALAKLKFLWHKFMGSCTRFVGIVYGIVPEWQGTGVDYFMIIEASKIIQTKMRYKELELQWQGDFNPKMISISKNLGASMSRRLVTYRFLFDQTREFKRHPILN
jgi:hypothetical protein